VVHSLAKAAPGTSFMGRVVIAKEREDDMDDIYPDDFYPDETYEEPDEESYQDDYDYEPAPKKSMSGWLIALIILLVLLVLCCICLCVATALLLPSIETMGTAIMETMEATTPMP
jgi:hypothetical protein